jgi:DNA polymerase elongation subunit (family B)
MNGEGSSCCDDGAYGEEDGEMLNLLTAISDDTDVKSDVVKEINNRILNDSFILAHFKYPIQWIYPPGAKYLVLLTMPSFDTENERAVLDYQNRHLKVLDKHLGAGNYGVATCTLGHNGNRFQQIPTATEMWVSVGLLKSFISTVKPQCILTIDGYPAELLRCAFNVSVMYMKRSQLTPHEPNPSMLFHVVQIGEFGRTHIDGRVSLRYLMLPKLQWTGKAFTAAILANRENMDKLHFYELRDKPICIYDSPYNFSRDQAHNYLTYQQCIKKFLIDDCSVYKERGLLYNAFDYSTIQLTPEYLFIRSFQYDPVHHIMNLFGSTLDGHPFLLNLTDVVFEFWFLPHSAFALEAQATGQWTPVLDPTHYDPFPDLTNESLIPLHRHLCSKLKWVKNYKDKDISKHITLTLDRAHVLKDTYRPDLKTVIKCTVTHYNYVKAIIQTLERLIKNAPVKSNEPFTSLEVFSAEQMFSYTYGFKVSHWYQIHNPHTQMQLALRAGCSFERQPVGTMKFSAQEPPLTCLAPEEAIPLIQGGDMNSGSVPPHIQISMDIECVDETQHFPDPWKNAINVICNTVWKRTKDSRVHKDTRMPLIEEGGYLYVAFILGHVEIDQPLDNGQMIIYEFDNEADMILAYVYWLHFMMPDYYMGHNFKSFDIGFVFQRAAVLGLSLPPIGRKDNEILRVDRRKFHSRAYGERTITGIRGMSGCVLMDTLEIYLRERKYRSNGLDYIASLLLKMKKNEMPYAALYGMWVSGAANFWQVVKYCFVDARLVDQLVNFDMWLQNACELSRVTGTVTEDQLYELGMQVKVLSTGMHIKKKRPDGIKVLANTPDGWSQAHQEEIIETYMLKNLDAIIDENGEEVDAEPHKDLPIWVDTRSKPLYSGQKRDRTTDEELSVKTLQPTFESQADGQVVKVLTDQAVAKIQKETAAARNKKQRKTAPLTERDEYEKVLREIKLNGGQEEIKLASTTDKYQGAVVMDVPLGLFYERPILCFDFAGLYPSIMMAHNISPDSKIYHSELQYVPSLTLDQLDKVPCLGTNPITKKREPYYFVKKEVWPGVIAEVEVKIKAARDNAKAQMSAAFKSGNAALGGVLNGRQNNFKLMGNSMYGSLGVLKGILADRDCAQAVTAWGREYIMLVRRVLERDFGGNDVTDEINSYYTASKTKGGDPIRRWFTPRAKCRGGDTDSVFMEFPGILINGKIKYHVRNRVEAEIFGPWVCNTILNPMFPHPMKLEYEKMMMRLITVAKKRYAYIHCEVGKAPRINSKGMETVRRDTTLFCQETLNYIQTSVLKMPKDELSNLLYPRPSLRRTKVAVLRTGNVPEDLPKNNKDINLDLDAWIERWQAINPDVHFPTDKEILKELPRRLAKWQADEDEFFRLDAIDVQSYKQNAVDFIRSQARKLLNGEVPITKCIQSKQRSREHYKNEKQPHLTVIKKKMERGEDVPQLGERVNFAYITLPNDPKTRKKRKAWECAEDPEKVILDNAPIDWVYYFENTFVKPVVRFMQFVLKDEMTDRIRKRRRTNAPKPSTSFFVKATETLTKTSTSQFTSSSSSSLDDDYQPEQPILLKELTLETRKYIFIEPTDEVIRKSGNPFLRYSKLLHNKRPAVPFTDESKSHIAKYRDVKDEKLNRIRRESNDEGGLLDIEDLIQVVRPKLLKAEETYGQCLKTCQDCVKQEVVICKAIHCLDYLPRVQGHGQLTRLTQDLTLLQDLMKEKLKVSNNPTCSSSSSPRYASKSKKRQ